MDFTTEALHFVVKTLLNTTSLLIGVIAYLFYRFLRANFEGLSWTWVSIYLVKHYKTKIFDRSLTNYDSLFVTLDLMNLQVSNNIITIQNSKKAERVSELLTLIINFTHDYFLLLLTEVVKNIKIYDVDSLSDHLARSFYDYCEKLRDHVSENFSPKDISREKYIHEFRILLDSFSYQIRAHTISLQNRIKNQKINMFQYLMAYQARFASSFQALFSDFAPIYFSKLNGELEGIYNVVSLKLSIVKAFVNSGLCVDLRTNTLVIYFKGYVPTTVHHKVVLHALDVIEVRQITNILIDFGSFLDTTSLTEWEQFFDEIRKRKTLSGSAFLIIDQKSEFYSVQKFGYNVYESAYFAYYEVLNATKKRRQRLHT